MLDEPTAVLGLLDRNAERLLAGEEPEDRETLLAACASVSPDQVRGLVERTLTTALLEIPQDAVAPGPGWTHYPARTVVPVIGGQVFVPAPHLDAGDRLTVAPDAVRVDSAGVALTIAWTDTAAVLRWSDGHRSVVAFDGASVEVDPDDWAGGVALPAAVDAVAPSDRWIDMSDAGNRSDRSTNRPHLSGLAAVSTGALVTLLVAFTLCLIAMASLLSTPDPEADPTAIYVIVGVLALVDLVLLRALRRRLRAPKSVRRPGHAFEPASVCGSTRRLPARERGLFCSSAAGCGP